jgi:hypothetical protein
VNCEKSNGLEAMMMKKFRNILISALAAVACVALLSSDLSRTGGTNSRVNIFVAAWSLPNADTIVSATPRSRAQFLQQSVAAAGLIVLGSSTISVASSSAAAAAAAAADVAENKLVNLSDADLKEIVRQDVVDHKFLTNGKLTRTIYDESATFTDEIDTYTMDKWIVGTQKLFVGDKSRVDLVGDIDVTRDRVEFRFDEDLMFNIPFKPVVTLTGKVVLQRSPDTGLITSYQEFWDQDVASVLKSAKF